MSDIIYDLGKTMGELEALHKLIAFIGINTTVKDIVEVIRENAINTEKVSTILVEKAKRSCDTEAIAECKGQVVAMRTIVRMLKVHPEVDHHGIICFIGGYANAALKEKARLEKGGTNEPILQRLAEDYTTGDGKN